MNSQRARSIVVTGVCATLAVLVVAQGVVCEGAVLREQRFSGLPGGVVGMSIVNLIVCGTAVVALLTWARPGRLRWRIAALVPALLLTLIADAPWLGAALWRAKHGPARRAIAYLRNVAAAQEQYRLAHGAYAPTVDSLGATAVPPTGIEVSLARHGDTGWSAQARLRSDVCTIWVRDSTLRLRAEQSEGTPECLAPDAYEIGSAVRTLLVGPPAISHAFVAADLGGVWKQHRYDAERRGTAPSSSTSGYDWTVRVGGELKAPVSVAGNQVFAGAHGNGELVALSLDSGGLGFRLRVPNWVHHEPVITPELVIVGYGNNQFSGALSVTGDLEVGGSAPSGIAAYDRLTGREIWRRATLGSVMTTPVASDSLVAVVTGAGEAVAWRASDGAERWRVQLPGWSAMGNPMLVDSMLLVGVEPRTLCAVDFHTGRVHYCSSLTTPRLGWGAGHVSVARAGRLALLTLACEVRSTRPVALRVQQILDVLRGASPRRTAATGVPAVRNLTLVAFDLADGTERWRVPLGGGTKVVQGHFAGTPVVEGDIAYVPSPFSGHVIAVDTRFGRILWSTAVDAARGSVSLARGHILVATTARQLVVLDARTGREECRAMLPGQSDRSGLTIVGETGILTLMNGMILARPMERWLACRV